MNLRKLIILSMAILGVAGASGVQAAVPTNAEGLVPVRSWLLDQLYLRPGIDLAGYRKIMIDPAQVEFRPDWNRDFADPHARLRRLSQDAVDRIGRDTAANMERALADAFRGRGYEVVSAPGPGVLRLSPSVADLYVNAAEDLMTGGTTRSFTKDVGEATLVLDARDGASGELIGRIVDRRTARETKGQQIPDVLRTSEVSNNLWFDQSFRRWAADCIKEFQASRKA